MCIDETVSRMLKIGKDQYVKVVDSSTDRVYLLYVPNHVDYMTAESIIRQTLSRI